MTLIIPDPFAGTGTTLIAARNLGMRGIATEIDPDYVRFAAQRMTRS